MLTLIHKSVAFRLNRELSRLSPLKLVLVSLQPPDSHQRPATTSMAHSPSCIMQLLLRHTPSVVRNSTPPHDQLCTSAVTKTLTYSPAHKPFCCLSRVTNVEKSSAFSSSALRFFFCLFFFVSLYYIQSFRVNDRFSVIMTCCRRCFGRLRALCRKRTDVYLDTAGG